MSVVGQESVMDRAWNDLIDESSTSIAILGPGGIGKTCLMKQLYNNLITTKHFENVIWITVSSKLTFQKIQTDITKNIGLFDARWAEKSSEEKSKTIRATMRGKKFVLFIDDLWFHLDLIALGVEGFKFIYSSRSTLLLMGGCSAMFTLKELSEQNAWQLFRYKVGDETLSNLTNIEIARKLVNLCNGLPILISSLGRAMASRKTDEEWKDKEISAPMEEVPLEVSRLVSLQYLNLSYIWIEWLPIELKMLTKLKCLNLEYDDQLRFIPKELISSLLSLRVLKMFRCGFSVEELDSNILSLSNMDIKSLLSLEHLKVLIASQ